MTFDNEAVFSIEMGEEFKYSDAYRPIAPPNSPVTLSWDNLSVASKSQRLEDDKYLIKGLSGHITGGFWAVMGPSGSGKTTFLSSLSKRIDPWRMSVTGKILLNGQEYDSHLLKRMSGYVLQDDLVHTHLTVGEILEYTAHLRMDRNTTSEERKLRQDEVIKLMGITHCKDVIVGDTRRQGISGGERKRLCIAMELLTKPVLLFLDEPTSGLDSATALAVTSTLKLLADKGECTVVSTIHQPQQKIFSFFDNLILMKSGSIVYQGSAVNAVNYFESLGYACPVNQNPADHLLDVLSTKFDTENQTEEELEKQTLRLSKIDKSKFVVPLDRDFGGTSSSVNVRDLQPWYNQFWILYKRSCHFHIRNWYIFALNMFVTVVLSLFISLSVWQNIGTGKASSSKRQALLFFCCIHQGIVASLQGSHSFPLERAVMLRERAAGSYYVSAYFLAKTFADITFQIPVPIVFTIIVYPITGLQLSVRKFFTFMGFMILDSLCATSLANAISCICVSIELSTVILALAYEWNRLYGGWFISPSQLEIYSEWRFADTLSYIKYAFVGVSLNENDGLVLNCTESELVGGKCTISPLSPVYTAPFTGDDFNEYYGYSAYSIGLCFGALVVYIVACRLSAYLFLRFLKI